MGRAKSVQSSTLAGGESAQVINLQAWAEELIKQLDEELKECDTQIHETRAEIFGFFAGELAYYNGKMVSIDGFCEAGIKVTELNDPAEKIAYIGKAVTRRIVPFSEKEKKYIGLTNVI